MTVQQVMELGMVPECPPPGSEIPWGTKAALRWAAGKIPPGGEVTLWYKGVNLRITAASDIDALVERLEATRCGFRVTPGPDMAPWIGP